MARTANPNKEKIAELKTTLKEHTKVARTAESTVKKATREAESATAKAEKIQAKIDKLSGVEDSPAPAKKTSKTEKVKKSSKDKDSKTKVVTQKKRGRPAKAASDEEDD